MLEMHQKLLRYLFVTTMLAMWIACLQPYESCAQSQGACEGIILDLDQKTTRLSEYVSALQNAHIERDHNFIKVLHGQIDNIMNEIRALEKALLNCPVKPGEIKSPLSSVKTQDDKFADLNCEALRKKHIVLSRKYNALARRLQSVFSEATYEQKSEYRDIEDSLRVIESELKRRCAPSPQNPLQKRTRSGDGAFR